MLNLIIKSNLNVFKIKIQITNIKFVFEIMMIFLKQI